MFLHVIRQENFPVHYGSPDIPEAVNHYLMHKVRHSDRELSSIVQNVRMQYGRSSHIDTIINELCEQYGFMKVPICVI